MPQTKNEIQIKTYILKYICDECGSGEMIGSNKSPESAPDKYLHTCTECSTQKLLDKLYPTRLDETTDF